MRAWKKRYCVAFTKNGGKVKLGQSYWCGFMKRHGHKIKAKKGIRFDDKRADWCTHANFKSMYEEVYSEMVAGGIAMKLDTPVWLSSVGKIVKSKEEAFGMKTKFILNHPHKLLFVDEVGSNSSQAKDGSCGGEKFLVPNKLRPQIKSACKDTLYCPWLHSHIQ